MQVKRIAVAAAIVAGTQAAPAPSLIDLGLNNWSSSLDLPNLLGTGSGSLGGFLSNLGTGLSTLFGASSSQTPDLNTLVKSLTGGLSTSSVSSLPTSSNPTNLLTALGALTGGSTLNPTNILGKVSTLTGGTTDPSAVLSKLTSGQTDLLSVLNKLQGGSISPTSNLLSALTGATTATNPSTVLGKVTQAGQLLNISSLITSLGLGPLQSGQIGNLNTTLGLVNGLLSAAIGQTKLPINANGLVLPTSDQKGLCGVISSLIQVEASLLNSLVKNNGVLSAIPALQNLVDTLTQVQVLTQTLVLQVVGLTPLCNVQQTEDLNGLSGVFQNLLQSITQIVPTVGSGLQNTIKSLLQTLTQNNGLLVSSPTSG